MNKIDFKSFPFILLRTPLQSFRHSYNFPDVNYSSLFAEGVYLSSPDFWKEFEKSEFKKNERTEATINKYWLRSCTRPTPFGTFAGCSLVKIDPNETSLLLEENSQHRRYLRLDTNYFTKIIEAIITRFALIDQLKFFPNNSLYCLHGKFRYVEHSIANNLRKYQLSAVDCTPYLSGILKRASKGATIQELVLQIKEFENVEDDEARTFVLNLIQEKLVVSELEPCVTGDEPLNQLIEKLASYENTQKLQQYLKHINHRLTNPGSGVDFYRNIEQDLQKLFSNPEGAAANPSKQVFQVDLFPKMEKKIIHEEVVHEIINQVCDLMLFSRPRVNRELENFKQLFSFKYNDLEVPLSVALDTDLGIGYAGVRSGSSGFDELIDNLPEYENAKGNAYEADHIVNYAIEKYHEFLRKGLTQIEITEEDLQKIRFKGQVPNYPHSMYIMGRLLRKNGKFDKSNFVFSLSSIDGPSGGRLMGRFAHGSEEINQAVKEILHREESHDPEAIFAEIVHLPQARLGNILLRPTFRKHEIPYVGNSGVDQQYQIPVDDLVIRMIKNKIVLISKKYNKRVIPRLTVAHNFVTNSLPVYKFLCDLQFQDISTAIVWDSGPFGTMKHFPRVIYKNIIVRTAWWKIQENELFDMPKGRSEQIEYVKKYCSERKISSRVVYNEGDNRLLIDFDDDKGVTLFLHYLRRKKQVIIEEFLFDESNAVVFDNKKDPYTNEIIIPIWSDNNNNANRTFSNLDNKIKDIKRNFTPYSEWLSFKIYCGSKMSETLLKTAIAPFIERSMEEKLFEQFFFIRYKEKDESPHLRFRFYNTDLEKQLIVYREFSVLLQPYVETGIIEKICLDTYSREIERYGGSLIIEAEELFYNDSLAVLRFLCLLDEESEQYRMSFAMRGIDDFLNDFKLDLADKLAVAKKMQHNFFLEFGGHSMLQKKLNDRYRKYQRFIFSHMNPENDKQNEISDGVAVFNERSVKNVATIGKILLKLSEAADGTLMSILPSYIHMFMNRLFITKQRKYELVIYHFLERFYTSQLALKKK